MEYIWDKSKAYIYVGLLLQYSLWDTYTLARAVPCATFFGLLCITLFYCWGLMQKLGKPTDTFFILARYYVGCISPPFLRKERQNKNIRSKWRMQTSKSHFEYCNFNAVLAGQNKKCIAYIQKKFVFGETQSWDNLFIVKNCHFHFLARKF